MHHRAKRFVVHIGSGVERCAGFRASEQEVSPLMIFFITKEIHVFHRKSQEQYKRKTIFRKATGIFSVRDFVPTKHLKLRCFAPNNSQQTTLEVHDEPQKVT